MIFVPKLLDKNIHKWIILIYLNTGKQYPSGEVGRACSRK